MNVIELFTNLHIFHTLQFKTCKYKKCKFKSTPNSRSFNKVSYPENKYNSWAIVPKEELHSPCAKNRKIEVSDKVKTLLAWLV